MKDFCYRMKVCFPWILMYIYILRTPREEGYQRFSLLCYFSNKATERVRTWQLRMLRFPCVQWEKWPTHRKPNALTDIPLGFLNGTCLDVKPFKVIQGEQHLTAEYRPDISRSLQVPYDIKVICVSNLHCLLWKPQGEDSQIFRLIWVDSLTKQEYLSFQPRMLLSDIVPSMFNDKKRGKVRRTQTDDLWIINPML